GERWSPDTDTDRNTRLAVAVR
ncbi:unnamed protein product, partial (mitochondrion) [Plasmodiophora brassicae]